MGGDFYWLRRFDDGFLLAVVDCTGHGVPGALMTMAVHSMLNHIVEDVGYADPAAVLTELDRRLARSFYGSAEGKISPGLEAAILFVSPENKLTFS